MNNKLPLHFKNLYYSFIKFFIFTAKLLVTIIGVVLIFILSESINGEFGNSPTFFSALSFISVVLIIVLLYRLFYKRINKVNDIVGVNKVRNLEAISIQKSKDDLEQNIKVNTSNTSRTYKI